MSTLPTRPNELLRLFGSTDHSSPEVPITINATHPETQTSSRERQNAPHVESDIVSARSRATEIADIYNTADPTHCQVANWIVKNTNNNTKITSSFRSEPRSTAYAAAHMNSGKRMLA